jgi:hypothetical protein
VAEDEDRTEGEELFEDLEKFFAPIQDVDWPGRPRPGPGPSARRASPARPRSRCRAEPVRRSTMAFETEQENDAEPATERVPASDAEEADELEERVSVVLSEAEAGDTTQTDEGTAVASARLCRPPAPTGTESRRADRGDRTEVAERRHQAVGGGRSLRQSLQDGSRRARVWGRSPPGNRDRPAAR